MNRFPLAVAATSLALVGALSAVGGLAAPNALASNPLLGAVVAGPPWANGQSGPPWANGGPWGGAQNLGLPPQLAGLADGPASERFAHFRGVQVQLTDKDNKPLNLSVTPGTATASNPTSLTIKANDGSTRTFTLNDKTVIHGGPGGQTAKPTINQNDNVVVVTLDNSTTATAVATFNPAGFGGGGHGPFGR